ncbi:restriction endonuclease subunit S [Streptomyces griseoloalbus]|uniref:Restriction endonuclease subunit S n=1 Tax=Streptomyces griseoloalbus TaxID=67303 RepID=A0ABV3E9Y6_9ACTN
MSDWKRTTVGDVVTLQRGFDITKAQQNPGNVPVVSSGGISSYHDTAMVEGPGVVMGRKGTLGKVFWLESDYWPHDTTLWVKDFKGNDRRFVYYFLGTLNYLSMNVGSSNPTLNRNHVHPTPINWPPLKEQRGIAVVLGALDDKIAVNERIATTTDAMVEALRQMLLAELDANFRRLGDIAKIVVGSTPSRAKSEYWTDGTVNWINSGKANEFRVIDPSEMITEDALVNSSVKMMPPGATLIGITGATMGKISRLEIPAGGSQNVAGVWADEPALNDWLFYDIKARVADLTKHASGGAQQHINKRIITELQCSVPGPDRLTAWSAKASPLVTLTARRLVENRTLAALRDTLLPQLMSGRLRVKDAEKIVEDAT